MSEAMDRADIARIGPVNIAGESIQPLWVTVGWVLAGGGLALWLYAFFGYDSSVPSSELSGALGGDRIINNGLLQRQLMISELGLSLLVGGLVWVAAGFLFSIIRLLDGRSHARGVSQITSDEPSGVTHE